MVAAFSGYYEHVLSRISVVMYLSADVMSIAWPVLLPSFRNLCAAKFEVIGELEAQMVYAVKWAALSESKDYKNTFHYQ